MTHSSTVMSMSRQPQVLLPPTSTDMWAGSAPERIAPAEWPGQPALSLAIDRVIREAIAAELSLRETYQRVRATLHAEGVHPDSLDLDRCIKDHVLGAI